MRNIAKQGILGEEELQEVEDAMQDHEKLRAEELQTIQFMNQYRTAVENFKGVIEDEVPISREEAKQMVIDNTEMETYMISRVTQKLKFFHF